MALVVLSITSGKGLQEAISEQFIQLEGDFRIEAYSINRTQEVRPIVLPDSLLEALNAAPYVEHVFPEVHKLALLTSPVNEAFSGVVLKGMDTAQFDFFFEHNRVIAGTTLGQGPQERYGVYISELLAQRLALAVGDTAAVALLRNDRQVPQLRKARIEGIYATPLQEFDEQFVLMQAADVRRLHRWNADSLSAYTVHLKQGEGRQIIADYWNALVPYDLSVKSIEMRNPAIFGWLELFDTNIKLVLAIVLIVALANLIIALLVLIIDRTQMIGTLKALGASNSHILRIFQWMALRILATGLLWGNVVGLLLSFVQYHYGLIQLDPSTYYIAQAPIAFNWPWILGANAVFLGTSYLVVLLPVAWIARLDPIKSIKFS